MIQMTERKNYHRGPRISKAKQNRMRRKIIGAGILCLFVVLIVQMASANEKEVSAQITLSVDNVSILQDEELPSMKITVHCPEAQQEVYLDKESGYQVKDLVDMLNQGEGYTVQCDGDGKTEGKFRIKAELNEDIQEKLKTKWNGLVYITKSDGYLKVKNKVGEWKGSKFQRYDGTYLKDEFVESKGKTYYLGTDGKRVTGWQDINGSRYCFTKKGIMEKDTWKQLKDGKGYLGEDGILKTGWLDLGEDTYYFDENGVMATGERRIASAKCVFSEDGKLVSRENRIDPNKPMMALTFDDGPGKRTMELLEVLERYDAHATFFMQGKNVPSYPEEVKKMVDIGCEIGNHSYDHPELPKTGDGGASQVGQTNELLKQACGYPATVMRPPYGAISDAVKAAVGLPLILWNIDTLDWKTMNAQQTIDCVLNTADDGDIVLMHDIHSTSVDAAIALIPKLIDNGYQLVTVSELAEARGLKLENGSVYTDFNK